MGMLTSALAALSSMYPDARDVEDPQIRSKHTVNLIAKIPSIAAAAENFRKWEGLPSHSGKTSVTQKTFFLQFMRMVIVEYAPDPTFTKALEQLFILHADHEQNCSTTAVRVVGSAHADPYSAIAAGSAALSGPRHGGANEAVINMLDQIGTLDNVDAFVDSVKNGDDLLWGFGHRVL